MARILDGLKVIDLSVARAGPVAVRQLADFGADVIRVESPSDANSIVRDHSSSDYINLHGNKRLITLDLKQPDGHRALLRLLATADVLVENFRPAVKQRLGIDFQTLEQRFPRLIYGSISGYGQTGPRADQGAVDQIMQGAAGLMSVTGLPESGPVRAGIAISDTAAGILLANGILLAVIERAASGRGQWVQVSLLEAVLSLLDFQAVRWTADHEVPGLAGNDHPSSTPMGAFRASDGLLNVAAPSDRLFSRLCAALAVPQLTEDPDFASAQARHAHRDRLKKQLQEAFGRRTRAEWIAILDEAGVPCGPVNSIGEAFQDPQARHLGMTVAVEHPQRGRLEVLRNPLSFSRSERAVKTTSPTASQHTDEILSGLGYTADEIASMHVRDVV
jgi:crotonobetainyl-CoA:carnitine CoA-transferase CaiB-like acyl-CoA transferase